MANISSLIRLTFIQNESLQALHPLVHALKFHPSKAPRLLGRRRAHVHVGHQLMRPRQAFLNLRGQVTTNHQILVVDGGWVLAGRFESVSCARGLFMMTDQSTKERGHAKKGATPYLNTLWCEWSERTPVLFPGPISGPHPQQQAVQVNWYYAVPCCMHSCEANQKMKLGSIMIQQIDQ